MAPWLRGRRFARRGRGRGKTSISMLALLLSCLIVLFVLLRRSRQSSHALLFITPRSGGFNNQLITVYQAIFCAKKHHRTAVLPLIYENVRADTTSKGVGPYPFEDYFDMKGLEKGFRVTTPARLDVEGLPCDTIHFASSMHFSANAKRIPRLLKQQYRKRYHLNLTYVDKSELFHGGSKYICVDDSLCDHPKEFEPYSDYNTSGQGYNIRASAALRNIRAAFQPSSIVQSIADHVMQGIGRRYNAMHVRRGDFNTKCDELPAICESFGNDSFVQSRDCLLKTVAEMTEPLPIFISTTHASECKEIFAGIGVRVIFMEDFGVPSEAKWTLQRTDIISLASQVVASHAVQFVGNRFSSYTTEINNMRYLRDAGDVQKFF